MTAPFPQAPPLIRSNSLCSCNVRLCTFRSISISPSRHRPSLYNVCRIEEGFHHARRCSCARYRQNVYRRGQSPHPLAVRAHKGLESQGDPGPATTVAPGWSCQRCHDLSKLRRCGVTGPPGPGGHVLANTPDRHHPQSLRPYVKRYYTTAPLSPSVRFAGPIGDPAKGAYPENQTVMLLSRGDTAFTDLG
jgi:hypothetical protein